MGDNYRDDHFEIRSEEMPDDMRVLYDAYPRGDWEHHPGFKERTRKWLGAHHYFRRLSEAVRIDIEHYLDGQKTNKNFAALLANRGSALVGDLHNHHNWEDNAYFPELLAADARFNAGLEILEKDHETLNLVLDSFIMTANKTITTLKSGKTNVRAEAGKLHETVKTIEAFLERHLGDEEDLAVPIILHYRLRG